MSEKYFSAKKIALMGIMLSIIIVLSFLEHMLPPIPFLPPNLKMGLSNIVTMYCLFFWGKREAVTVAIIKSFFVFLMRGVMASILSLFGGLLAIFIIILLMFIFKNNISYLILSIAGAITHNIGQIIAISILLHSGVWYYYIPILIISGVIMGSITGVTLKVVMPIFNNIMLKNNIEKGVF